MLQKVEYKSILSLIFLALSICLYNKLVFFLVFPQNQSILRANTDVALLVSGIAWFLLIPVHISQHVQWLLRFISCTSRHKPQRHNAESNFCMKHLGLYFHISGGVIATIKNYWIEMCPSKLLWSHLLFNDSDSKMSWKR